MGLLRRLYLTDMKDVHALYMWVLQISQVQTSLHRSRYLHWKLSALAIFHVDFHISKYFLPFHVWDIYMIVWNSTQFSRQIFVSLSEHDPATMLSLYIIISCRACRVIGHVDGAFVECRCRCHWPWKVLKGVPWKSVLVGVTSAFAAVHARGGSQ